MFFDLLIATIALNQRAEVVTFDDDFQKIASGAKLHAQHLKRPKVWSKLEPQPGS